VTLGGGAGTSTLASESSICGLDLGLRLDLGLTAGTLATGASTAGASAAGCCGFFFSKESLRTSIAIVPSFLGGGAGALIVASETST
jgi:hypothetical protein